MFCINSELRTFICLRRFLACAEDVGSPAWIKTLTCACGSQGGKFYFLEHVAHPAGTWRRRVQNLLSNSGFWPAVFDGCVLNKEFEEVSSVAV